MRQKFRRIFTDEQKAEAVCIVDQSGKPIRQVTIEMGLSALCNCVKQAQVDQAATPDGALTTKAGVESTPPRCQTAANGARFLKKGRSLLCGGKQPYELIQAEKANFPVQLMCEALDLSKSGYYAWCKCPVSPELRRMND